MHLKYAVEIAQTGSLNKAAENLYMGQPNLSRAIKELEASLGITIFERSAKGMIATPEGERFLGYAKKILEQIEKVEAIYKSGMEPRQTFSVCVPKSGYISDAFVRFSNAVDKDIQSELFYKEADTMQTISNVLKSDYKLGIIRYAEDDDKFYKDLLEEKGLFYEMAAEFTAIITISRENPLADREELSLEDIVSLTCIEAYDPEGPAFSGAPIKVNNETKGGNKRIFAFDRESRLSLLAENSDTFMWGSPLPKKTLERYSLVQKSCSDFKKKYKDVMIYRKDYRLTELDSIFITELCKSKREIL